MKVLSHRGYWKTAEEKNTAAAFERSFRLGFGTETDVRDLNGRLVISHDMPTGNPMALTEFMRLVREHAPGPLPLALNIKADGLAAELAETMAGDTNDWFVFDMSVPDMREFIKRGMPVYSRMSEVEKQLFTADDGVQGIWLDAFQSTWYSTDTISSLLAGGRNVCVVSPELHRRDDFRDLWCALEPLKANPNLSLCTDLPEDAASQLGLG